jgi:O-glycosyl hydrolase
MRCGFFFWLAASCLPLPGATLGPSDILAGGNHAASFDGSLELIPSAGFGVGPDYFGISGGENPLALDDADGMAPADEWLDMGFPATSGLERIDVKWTRAVVRVSGFQADPQADAGSFDPASGVWSVVQPWTGSAMVSFRFANPAASAGRTLRVTVGDPFAPGPQIAFARVWSFEAGVEAPDVILEANPAAAGQVIDHFGASMLWSIDPTKDWPEGVREKLALRLVSPGDGIGLSNLRFDFGGGDNGTGNQTEPPWNWRFPQVLKDGAGQPFDWTRREGQQWFLRRTRDLGLEKFTLASISPPWWLTKNGRAFCSNGVGGSNLDPAQAGAYADYLVDVIRHFRDTEGVTFSHVSPLNEPEWPWEDGSQEGCRYRAEDARPLVAALHQRLVTGGLDGECKILLGEHGVVNSMLDDAFHQMHNGSAWDGGNNSLGYGKYREYLKDLATHPDVVGKIDPVAAYHSYGTDGVDTLNSNLRTLAAENAAQRGVGLVQTEYCILGGYGPLRDLQMEPARHVFRVIHKDLTDAKAVGWSWWLALSPHDYKDGLIYTNNDGTQAVGTELYESKVYWILGQFSRFVRPGWRQIGGGNFGDTGGLMSSTWLSPDGRETAIVAANFGTSALVAGLPGAVGGLPVREWEPWVTDRSRSLQRQQAVSGRFTLAPLSVTTLVGRTNPGIWCLRVAVEGNESPVSAGANVQLTAKATWEDGLYQIPSPDPGAAWVFEPMDKESVGKLRAGRYHIRRESDGHFLDITENGELAAPVMVSGENSGSAAWDVHPQGADRLLLTHVATNRVLTADATAVRTGGAAVAVSEVPVAAQFEWSDGLGSMANASFQATVPRRVMVMARTSETSSAVIVPVRVGGGTTVIEGLPEMVFTRPGEPVTLTAALRDDGQPWRFRIVPADRDSVIATGTAASVMKLPTGAAGESWELVEPGGGRIWMFPETGRNCWIRSVSTGRSLAPLDGLLVQDTPLIPAEAGGAAQEWRIDPDVFGKHRILHVASGLVLNISGATGLPILWPDVNVGNDRFHLDSTGAPPTRLSWSHGLGSGTSVTVSPQTTRTITAHADEDGWSTSSSTTIVVRRSFEEWAQLWFGETVAADSDADGDGASALLEFSRGSNPRMPESPSAWQKAVDQEFVWQINREALGAWQVQASTDLLNWQGEESGLFAITANTADEIRALPTAGDERVFLRIAFRSSLPE